MEILFCNYKSFDSLKTDLAPQVFDILVLNFCYRTPYFLTRKYYKILEFLKGLSKDKNCTIVFTFYIKNSHKYVNALIINDGEVESVFGEAFSYKQGEICANNKKVLFLFHYDLYSKIDEEQLKDVSLVIGLEDDLIDNFKFLSKKFLKKIVVVDSLFRLEPYKNIDKICENMCKYYVQN